MPAPVPPAGAQAVTVVMATRGRRESALGALERLSALPEEPSIVVVDNASTDGTARAVRTRFPKVDVVELPHNVGAAGRNVGVRRARTPYVAFSDDDSWWAPGSLGRAATLLDRHPRLAVVAARVLVGPEERLDPTCLTMARSPLRHRHLQQPGTAVLGFVACGAVVRRSAFLRVGGFCPRFVVGGEEELLCLDLAQDGWDLAYVEDVIAHHHPSPQRDPVRRRRAQTRNALWSTWLRRPAGTAIKRSGRLLRPLDRTTLAALVEAMLGLPWVLANRRVLGDDLEASLRLLE